MALDNRSFRIKDEVERAKAQRPITQVQYGYGQRTGQIVTEEATTPNRQPFELSSMQASQGLPKPAIKGEIGQPEPWRQALKSMATDSIEGG